MMALIRINFKILFLTWIYLSFSGMSLILFRPDDQLIISRDI
jgi:hypothetical protein